MPTEIKRRHHYVWREYLRSWANNEYIYCCFNEKEIKHLKLDKVAVEKDFYKLKKLNQHEIDNLNLIISKQSCQYVRQLSQSWLLNFTYPYDMNDLFEKVGIDNKKFRNWFNSYINNREEDLHTAIEESAIKYIKSILNEDVTFYNDSKDCFTFIFYICMQNSRTANVKNKIITSYKNINMDPYSKNISMENSWGPMNFIVETQAAYSILNGKDIYKIVLLKNESSKEFITSDQPIINTFARENPQEIEDLEFYYPVSPKLAILITERPRYNGITKVYIKEYEVSKYNQMVIDISDTQVYATSEKVLKECGLPKNQ